MLVFCDYCCVAGRFCRYWSIQIFAGLVQIFTVGICGMSFRGWRSFVRFSNNFGAIRGL
ncbi:hypothetical protein MNBD_ALPHA11-1006 [hydrothermal vent metagenome]|uniref:Uncharacterized protein n=1 Tax=hydrothermal vent metagenome TaxID=652676 RepID=A0A3B0TRQ6_9ZZZZ